MRKGRIVVLDQVNDKPAAALLVNGQLQDLLIEKAGKSPQPEAIYRARAGLPMKGQNGLILDLGHGQKGFLRNAKGIPQGTHMTVQVTTHAEPGKAAPVVNKLIFKSRYCIITPDAPGLNIARSIKDDDERERLLEIVHNVFGGFHELCQGSVAGTRQGQVCYPRYVFRCCDFCNRARDCN